MAKIGIVTWFFSNNYGTCIQCYALTKFLTNKGHDVYVPETYRFYYGIKHPIETISHIKNKIKLCKKNSKNTNNLDDELQRDYRIRNEKNKDFAYSYNKIYSIHNKKEFKTMLNELNVFITGSDQIWNPLCVTPPFLLSMVESKKKKIAYGSSIGVNQIPKDKQEIYKKYLSRFDYIGVREETASHILNELIDKRIDVVMDPSFLLSNKEWALISKRPTILNNQKFIFCYFIGDNRKWESEVNEFSKKINIPVFCALSESSIVPSIGKALSQMGVEEFIWCLLHAEYVITDSFHACALSINYNQQFMVYKRFIDNSKDSQNSRVLDLLTQFKLKNRLVDYDCERSLYKIAKKNIEYNKVNQILSVERSKSMHFLLEAIN